MFFLMSPQKLDTLAPPLAGAFWYRIIIRAVLWSDDKHQRLIAHYLRRTLGSWQAMENVSLLKIAKTMAHSNPVVTRKVYECFQVGGARGGIETSVSAMKRSAGVKESEDKTDTLLESLSEADKAKLLARLLAE